MPESVRKSQVRELAPVNVLACLKVNATAHAKMTTTVVRTAVAKLLSTPAMPILARIAVAAAKTADRSAQLIQVNLFKLR